MARVPFSKRKDDQSRSDFSALRDGVPDGLLRTLVDFVIPHLYLRDEFDGRMVPQLEVHNYFARLHDTHLAPRPEDAFKQFVEDRTLLLDAVDFVLGLLTPERHDHGREVGMLMAHLNEAACTRSAGTAVVSSNFKSVSQRR